MEISNVEVKDGFFSFNYRTIIVQPKLEDGKTVIANPEIFEEENVKFVIKYNFDLEGSELTIHDGSILEFDGGSISNGTINGNNIKIINPSGKEYFNNITFNGSYKEISSNVSSNLDFGPNVILINSQNINDYLEDYDDSIDIFQDDQFIKLNWGTPSSDSQTYVINENSINKKKFKEEGKTYVVTDEILDSNINGYNEQTTKITCLVLNNSAIYIMPNAALKCFLYSESSTYFGSIVRTLLIGEWTFQESSITLPLEHLYLSSFNPLYYLQKIIISSPLLYPMLDINVLENNFQFSPEVIKFDIQLPTGVIELQTDLAGITSFPEGCTIIGNGNSIITSYLNLNNNLIDGICLGGLLLCKLINNNRSTIKNSLIKGINTTIGEASQKCNLTNFELLKNTPLTEDRIAVVIYKDLDSLDSNLNIDSCNIIGGIYYGYKSFK